MFPTGTPTFLFTDIEGSTRLVEALGDRYATLLETQRRLIREACIERGGVEFGTGGDAVFVAFPRASDAFDAAAAAQRALYAHVWPDGVAVGVRMGVHTGEAEVVDGDYVGLALHVAARVCAAAHGGQVLLTEATRQLIGDRQTLDLGEHRLRSVVRSVRLHQAAIDGLDHEFPAPRTLTALPNNLPAATDEFVGREVEMLEVGERLDDHRLVTLVGAGGSGKTRLALQVASSVLPHWPDGVWLVELAATTDSSRVAPLTASVLHIGERRDQLLVDTLHEALRHRRLLLVLDNCEHLIESVADFVGALLRLCPQVHVLATSRELLGVRGEQALRVAPLSVEADEGRSEAVRLFITRAQEAVPGFEAEMAGLDLIGKVCRRLDGLPLAIELAAARLRTLSLPQVAARLDDRFRLLTGGARTDMSRQRTLEAVVGWSYDLLPTEERRLFRRLAVFPDNFDLEGAEAVGGCDELDSVDVVELLGRLVEKSLVVTVERPAGYRYQMLETVRQYGRDRLVEHDEAAPTRDCLLTWAMGWADRLDEAMRTPGQDAAIAAVAAERANTRAALDWALDKDDSLAALRMVSAVPIALNTERRALIMRLLDELPVVPVRVRANALDAVANLAFEQSDWEASIRAAAGASQAYVAAGDERRAAWCRYFLLHSSWGMGDVDTVDRLAAELEQDFRRLDDPMGLAYVLWVTSQRTDFTTADARAAEAETLFRELGSPIGLAHDLEGRGILRLRREEPAFAAPFLAEALDLFVQAGNVGCSAHALEASSACAALYGDLTEAAVLLGAAEEARRVSGQGHRPWELWAPALSRARLEADVESDVIARAVAEGRALPFASAVTRAGVALGHIAEVHVDLR